MPLNDMRYLLEIHPNPTFISYLTTEPRELSDFIKEFDTFLGKDKKMELNLFGSKIQSVDPNSLAPNIKIFKSIPEFANQFSS
jgi:hypothetical protein